MSNYIPTDADILRKEKFGRTSQPLTVQEWIRLSTIWRLAMEGEIRFYPIAFDNNRYALFRAQHLMGLGTI